MARRKHTLNRRGLKEAALGAVGVSLSLAGGASAATTGPATDTPSLDTAQPPQIAISEEEISDVNLATFYVFDKENAGTSQVGGEKVAWWRGCRGCRCGCGFGCRRCWGCGCRC
jgi:hypothetical protein